VEQLENYPLTFILDGYTFEGSVASVDQNDFLFFWVTGYSTEKDKALSVQIFGEGDPEGTDRIIWKASLNLDGLTQRQIQIIGEAIESRLM
jgi:hypothetical protein